MRVLKQHQTAPDFDSVDSSEQALALSTHLREELKLSFSGPLHVNKAQLAQRDGEHRNIDGQNQNKLNANVDILLELEVRLFAKP